jgi:hypothetical protein
LRLWTTDDARCLLQSHASLFSSQPQGICALQEYPGLVAVYCDDQTVAIIDTYTMHSVYECKVPKMKAFHTVR